MNEHEANYVSKMQKVVLLSQYKYVVATMSISLQRTSNDLYYKQCSSGEEHLF